MRKSKQEFLCIKQVYTTSFLHTLLWGFVEGQRQNGIPVTTAVTRFIEYFGAQELSDTSLRNAYYSKDKELKKCMPGISGDIKTVFKEDEADKILMGIKNILTNG